MSNKRARSATRSRPRPSPAQARRPKKRFPVLPVVFGVVAVALVGAIVFTGGESQSDEDRIAAAAGIPQISGEELPRHISGAPDSSVGLEAPRVTGQDFEANTVTIEPTGTPTAVLFLAHWCPHCQSEVPRIQQWLNETGGVDGVDIVSVSTVYRPAQGNWPPQEWLEDEGWSVPVLRDDARASVHTAFGAGGFPYWVFIDGEGMVAGRASGEMGVAQIEALLLALRDA